MSEPTVGDMIQDAQMEAAMRRQHPYAAVPGTKDWDFYVCKVGYVREDVSADRKNGDEVLFIKHPSRYPRKSFWFNTRTGREYPYETVLTRSIRWVAKRLGIKLNN